MASEPASALIEFRLLKRKCGFTWAFERAELSVASEHVRFHQARLGLLRRLQRQNHVIKGD